MVGATFKWLNHEAIVMYPKTPARKQSIYTRRKVFGVGVNDSEYEVTFNFNGKRLIHNSYAIWKGMMQRGYDPKLKAKRESYKDVKVCDEWLYFSAFDKWYNEHYIDGYCLDKDIKTPGNKVYSPDDCMFVPVQVNNIIIDSEGRRGEHPIGVTIDNRSGRFHARVYRLSKLISLGWFSTAEEAHEAYKRGKNESIDAVIDLYPEFKEHLSQYKYKIRVNNG